MPMNLTVSRNRKKSKDFNSEGFGVSFTVELDQSLLNQPKELQRQIDYLYREAESALDQQVNDGGSSSRNGSSDRQPNRNGNGQSNGNGNNMTAAQSRAINAIAKRLGVTPADECHHEFGLELKELTVRQASQMIDHLKQLEQPASRNGGSR
jgi:hypothetical protein